MASKSNPYPDWVNGRLGNTINDIKPDESGQVLCSPVFDMSQLPTNRNNILVRNSLSDETLMCILYAAAGYSAATTRWQGNLQRTLRHYPNYDLLRIEVLANEIDDCYIYDLSNMVFVWKGRKVTEPI